VEQQRNRNVLETLEYASSFLVSCCCLSTQFLALVAFTQTLLFIRHCLFQKLIATITSTNNHAISKKKKRLVRHIFFPSLRMGVNRTVAVLIVFTVSAILHEVLVSVPFHILSIPWSFIGMMGQVPLVAITKFLVNKNPGSSIGNIVFWLTFCVIGQPMAILMYTADYQYAKLNREQ